VKRDEEFFLEEKAIKFVCKYIREKYPEHSYLLWIRYACDVLRDCIKDVPD
jgi:hypothetical protein